MNIIRIDSIENTAIKPFILRSEKKLLRWNEPEPGLFVAESPNVIKRAIESGYEPLSFLMEEDGLSRSENDFIYNLNDVPVYVASKSELSKMIGFELTRGLLCLFKRKEAVNPYSLLPLNASSRICILEDVENPTNLGSIFRSAAALNIDAIFLTKGCSDPLYRRAARVSMGSVFQIPWGYVGDNFMTQIKNHGYKTVSMALVDRSLSVDDMHIKSEPKLAIIMGSEGYGLKSETIRNSDYVVKIPMSHNVDSLNVAAASAIAFWELSC